MSDDDGDDNRAKVEGELLSRLQDLLQGGARSHHHHHDDIKVNRQEEPKQASKQQPI